MNTYFITIRYNVTKEVNTVEIRAFGYLAANRALIRLKYSSFTVIRYYTNIMQMSTKVCLLFTVSNWFI